MEITNTEDPNNEQGEYLVTKSGNIIEIPDGVSYQYVKDNNLLVQNLNGTSSLWDETGEEIWSVMSRFLQFRIKTWTFCPPILSWTAGYSSLKQILSWSFLVTPPFPCPPAAERSIQTCWC